MKYWIAVCEMFLCVTVQAQDATFYKDIYPIIQKNCISCHNRKNGAGPFALDTYDEVAKNAKLIQYVTNKGIMPPWKADTTYRHFKDERILSQREKQMINQWVNSGCTKGHESNENKKRLVFQNKLGKPDMTIQLSRPYSINGNNEDCFITYVQKIDLKENRLLKAIEIIPGNRKIVHHCRVDFTKKNNISLMVDKDGFMDTQRLIELGTPEYSFVGDYVPGISPYIYPEDMGYYLPSELYILINIHYSPTSAKTTDQTKVNLYFHEDTVNVRKVLHTNLLLGYRDVVENSLYLKPNAIDCFTLRSEPTKRTSSLISIQPHMHLFGKSMKIYAISADDTDTIPLCLVNNWDFKWQENYYFPQMIKIPKGYILVAEACYDNTSNNPYNPYNPPRKITFLGDMKTTNEMMEFYLQEVEYKEGDENLKLYK